MASKTTATESAKTPYELRLEMLQMAKDYLDRQYELATSATMSAWHENLEFAKKISQKVEPPKFPTIYSIDEMTKLADQFNQFVSGSFGKK
jgi:hypothetical protein